MFDKPLHTTAGNAIELPDNQRLAVEALLAGQRRSAAASAAGVTLRTLQRWFHDPLFQSALHQGRCEAWSEVTGDLHSIGHEAVAALREVLTCDQPRARVMAARAVLQLSARALELESLVQRMTQMEADLEDSLASRDSGSDAGGGSPTPPTGSPAPSPTPNAPRPTPTTAVATRHIAQTRQNATSRDTLPPLRRSPVRNAPLVGSYLFNRRAQPHPAPERQAHQVPTA